MSDTTTDEAADIQLEDMTDGLESTEETESQASDEESKEETKAEEADEKEAETEETEGEAEAEAEAETEETETEETESTESEEEVDEETTRKEAARKAYQERQARRQERDQAIIQARDEDLKNAQEQGADDEQIAIKQLQWVNYENTVNANTERLQSQYERALSEIDLFKNPTPAIQNMLNDAIDEFQAKNVTFDRLGNPLEVKGNLTEFLTIKAGLIEDIAKLNVVKGKEAAAKQRKAVTPKPSGSPRQAVTNKDIDDFESYFNQ